MKQCPVCSNACALTAVYCNHCGFQFEKLSSPPVNSSPVSTGYVNQLLIEMYTIKLHAALIAIFLGWLGIHKFYLKKRTQGIIYLLFFWTGIPGVVGVMEGIRYACLSTEHFAISYNKNRILEKKF